MQKKTYKIRGDLVRDELEKILDNRGWSLQDLVSHSKNGRLQINSLHRLMSERVSMVQRATVRQISDALDMQFQITEQNGVKFLEKEKGGDDDYEFTDFEKGLVMLLRTLPDDKQEIVFKLAETLRDSSKVKL